MTKNAVHLNKKKGILYSVRDKYQHRQRIENKYEMKSYNYFIFIKT